MPNGVCVPYRFEDEFQRIRDYINNLQSVTPFDLRPPARVSITGTGFLGIIEFVIPSDKTLWLAEIGVSVLGFASEVVAESNGPTDGIKLIRSYVLNVQQPSITERLSAPIPIQGTANGTVVRVRARQLHGAGTNGEGAIFASLNGWVANKSVP